MASGQSQMQVKVQGTFKNETFARLELMKIETYSGFFEDGGPEAIFEKDAKTSFKHIGIPPDGSKVGVAYRGPNGDQWVLAWRVFLDVLPVLRSNKVLAKHVKAGETIDWEKIEKELNETHKSEVDTPYFKAKVSLTVASKAELNVTFLNLPRD